MTTKTTILARGLLILLPVGALTAATPASARESALAGQPMLRNKFELRKARFELTPAFETSMNADYRHTVGGGLRAEYHLSDWLSAGGAIYFGAGMNTGLTDEILKNGMGLPGCAMDNPADPTPTICQVQQHMNDMPLHG